MTTQNGNGRHKEFFSRRAIDLQELQQELAPDPHFAVQGQPPNGGRTPVPHIFTFSGIHSNAARTYLPSDEALRNSRDNARYMRNDPVVMECMDSRQRATSLLEWEVLPDNDRSTEQKELAEEVTKILRKIRRFNEYRRNLMHAVWFGKYGIQHEYRWNNVAGNSRVMPWPKRTDLGWLPVDGDKLVFRFDDGSGDHLPGQVGIRIGASGYKLGDDVLLKRPNGQTAKSRVEATSQGLAYFLPQYERDLLAIHKHEIEDAPWERGIEAGSIHGVGVRSRIYWAWMQKQELLGFLIEYLERSAGGIEIWSYPQGNPQAKEAVQTAAKERVSHGRNIIFFPKPLGEDAMAYDVNIVEPGMAGIEAVKQVLTEYFGHQIKRYILGQTLSSEADATGLGSGLAELHMDSFFQIITYDARNLEETITYELLSKIQRWNFPKSRHIDLRFSIKLDDPSVEERLNGLKTAWEMGCKLSAQEVMELVGASVPGEDDEILQNPQVQQAAMQAQMFGGPGPAGITQDGDGDGVAGEGQGQDLGEHINDTLMGDMFGEPGPDAQHAYSAEGGEWVQRELPYDTGERHKVGEYAADSKPHKFSCTMAMIPGKLAERFKSLTQRIPDADLAADGREEEPHITVKYGTHTSDPDDLRKVLAGEGPIRFTLGKVSIFPAKEATSQRGGDEYDVVKIDVESDDLRRLNKKISDALEHTDTHPTYQPHLTLAYVKPGEGKKYVGQKWAEGVEMEIDTLVFSDQDQQHTEIPLKGKDRYSKSGERWITINADEDGKGGTAVQIDGDGTIAKGPASLKNKQLSDLDRKQQETGKAADYDGKRKKSDPHKLHSALLDAHKNSGYTMRELRQAAADAWEMHRDYLETRERAKDRARQLTGLNAGSLGKLENAYTDHSSRKKFDTAARSLAYEFPGLGIDPDNASESVWSLLREGKSEIAPHSPEVISEAVDMLRANVRRKSAEKDRVRKELEKVPFSKSRYAAVRNESEDQKKMDWDESQHPRNADGEFTDGATSGLSVSDNFRQGFENYLDELRQDALSAYVGTDKAMKTARRYVSEQLSGSPEKAVDFVRELMWEARTDSRLVSQLGYDLADYSFDESGRLTDESVQRLGKRLAGESPEEFIPDETAAESLLAENLHLLPESHQVNPSESLRRMDSDVLNDFVDDLLHNEGWADKVPEYRDAVRKGVQKQARSIVKELLEADAGDLTSEVLEHYGLPEDIQKRIDAALGQEPPPEPEDPDDEAGWDAYDSFDPDGEAERIQESFLKSKEGRQYIRDSAVKALKEWEPEDFEDQHIPGLGWLSGIADWAEVDMDASKLPKTRKVELLRQALKYCRTGLKQRYSKRFSESEHPRDESGQFTDTPEVSRQKEVFESFKSNPERYVDQWLKHTDAGDFFDGKDYLIPSHVQDAMDAADNADYGEDAADQWLQEVYFQSEQGLQDARNFYNYSLRTMTDAKLAEELEDRYGAVDELPDLDLWDWLPADATRSEILTLVRANAPKLAAERFTADDDFGAYLEENPKAWNAGAKAEYKAIKTRKPTSSDDVKEKWVKSEEAREIMRQHIQGEIDGMSYEQMAAGDEVWNWGTEAGWDELERIAKPKRKKEQYSRRQQQIAEVRQMARKFSPEGRVLFSRALSESRASGSLRDELRFSERIAGTVRGRREISRVYNTLYGAN